MGSSVSVSYTSLDDWLRARKTGIGASESAAILGLSSFKSPYAVWADKISDELPAREETARQRWGHKLEAVIAEEFESESGVLVSDPGLYTVYYGEHHMLCTPDRLTMDGGVLEIKTAGIDRTKDWESGPPLAYQVQVQHQIACVGSTHGYLAVLIGGSDFRWFRLERNQKFIEALERQVDTFWAMVTTRTPPVIDGHASTRDALSHLHPADDGSTVMLDELYAGIARELVRTKAEAKELDSKVAALENQLRAAIGDATFGEADGMLVSLKTQTRDGYLKVAPDKALALDNAGIEFKATAGSTFRVLRVKETSNG